MAANEEVFRTDGIWSYGMVDGWRRKGTLIHTPGDYKCIWHDDRVMIGTSLAIGRRRHVKTPYAFYVEMGIPEEPIVCIYIWDFPSLIEIIEKLEPFLSMGMAPDPDERAL